jgi:hypothetical protein
MTTYGKQFGILAVVAGLVSLGCETSPTVKAVGEEAAAVPVLDIKYANPTFDPAKFVGSITNPYLTLTAGTTFHYRSETPDGVELNDVSVTYDNTKHILGVTVTVIHDEVFVDGNKTEDALDWLAQDADGNVWYFGEDTKEFDENGNVTSTQGSWEAGVGNNHPGIIMLAHPRTGAKYQQEIAPGIAEDVAVVLSLQSKVDVPYGKFSSCLETMESTPLEPGDREHKFYCAGVGLLLEVQPKGGRIRNELIAISHF